MLTVKQIEAAKPKEKPYRLLDGNGLYEPPRESWRLNFLRKR